MRSGPSDNERNTVPASPSLSERSHFAWPALLIVAAALTANPRVAAGQQPLAAPSPAVLENAQPVEAGVIPPTLGLSVTGSPADGEFLYTQICNALDREIRPTLHPGASIHFGSVVPWPLLPVAPGTRAALTIGVTLDGGNNSETVDGFTQVVIANEALAPATPSVLFLSDDPEYLRSEGLVFRGRVDAGRAVRLYYYHSDIGLPRDVDVVLTTAVPSRLAITQAAAGPDLDAMSVGHAVSKDLPLFEQQNESVIVDLTPGVPFVVRHDLIFQDEVVAGAVDLHPLSGGPVKVSVIASPAGGHPETYLDGPRVAYDGHNRHGIFALDGYGDIATTFTAGGPDVAVKYGQASPPNVDPADAGRDFGEYGVVHQITFKLVNPTDGPRLVYLYEKPLGGSVRSTFFVDGQLKEVGCARVEQPYWFMTYRMPPHSVSASTTKTMTDGGSSYPLEFGTTENRPAVYTPPLDASDGCSPSRGAPPVSDAAS